MEESRQQHQRYMRRALALARRGEGFVQPNPMVGAVLVREGQVVGEGFHAYFGGPHAEVGVFRGAGEHARGATLYVTLEPCCYHGKTPPCTEAVRSAGVARVVAAVRDPNPLVQGKGLEELRRAGIEVIEGVLEEEARRLNAAFFKVHETGLPYLIAKWAMTLDGKIATRLGDSQWISTQQSRSLARIMRSKAGAVMVGMRTVMHDNPSLLGPEEAPRQPKRVILDSRARLPKDFQLIRQAKQHETYVAVTSFAPADRRRTLEEAGCHVLEAREIDGRVALDDLMQLLPKVGITKIMLEGGGELIASAFEHRLVDEVCVFVAPKIIGGRSAISPVEGLGIGRVAEAPQIEDISLERIDHDVMIRGRVRWEPS